MKGSSQSDDEEEEEREEEAGAAGAGRAPPPLPLEGWAREDEEARPRLAEAAAGADDGCSLFSFTMPGTLLAGPEGGGHPDLPLGAEPGPPSSESGGDLPAR